LFSKITTTRWSGRGTDDVPVVGFGAVDPVAVDPGVWAADGGAPVPEDEPGGVLLEHPATAIAAATAEAAITRHRIARARSAMCGGRLPVN
jgi:hypothetical protein